MKNSWFYILLIFINISACGPSSEEQLVLARTQMQSGNFTGAKSILDLIIAKDPKNQSAYNMRGIAALELGETEEAINDFGTSISLDSMEYRSFYNRGNAYYQLEKYDKAMLDYDRALVLEQKSPDIYINRGNALVGLESYDQAVLDFSFAVKIDHENYLAHFNLARTYYLMDSLVRAENAFRKCIEVYGTYAPAHYFLGMIALENGEKDKMCGYFKQASELGYQQAVQVYNIYCNRD